MGHIDGVLFAVEENDNVFIDLSIIKYIDGNRISKLFWDNDIQMTVDKNFIIELFNELKVDMMPGQLRKMRNYPSRMVTFVKVNGRPGWFTMTIPKESDIAEEVEDEVACE